MCYSMWDCVGTTGLCYRDLPSQEAGKKVIYAVTLAPLKKKSVKNIFTPVLQFSAKIVNYCADEFHSFIKEN